MHLFTERWFPVSQVTQWCLTPWTAARQASLSITSCWSLLKLMSIESVMSFNHLILCRPLLLLPLIFPSIRVFSSGQIVFPSGDQSIGASASASVLPINIQDWFPLRLTALISLQSKGLSRVFSNTTVQKHQFLGAHSVQFSSVAQSCPTLCNPMDCSMPGLPVHHQLPEFTQTHVHWVGDTIQPSHPLLSPSSPTFNFPQHQGLFQWVSSLHQVVKVLEFQLQHQSFQWIFRTDFL